MVVLNDEKSTRLPHSVLTSCDDINELLNQLAAIIGNGWHEHICRERKDAMIAAFPGVFVIVFDI